MSSSLPTDEALEKEGRIDEMKKKNIYIYSPPVLYLLQTQQALTLPYAKVVGRPGTGSYPAPSPDPTTHNFLCCLSFFVCYRRRLFIRSNLISSRWIWLEFKLIQYFMPVLVTCKFDDDPIKNTGAIVSKAFLPLLKGR